MRDQYPFGCEAAADRKCDGSGKRRLDPAGYSYFLCDHHFQTLRGGKKDDAREELRVDKRCPAMGCDKPRFVEGEHYYPACRDHWHEAKVMLVGPVKKGYCGCWCGEVPDVFMISGVGDRPPYYWLCPKCGAFEVVIGTPTTFGPPFVKEVISGVP